MLNAAKVFEFLFETMACLNKQHTLEQQPCANATYGTGMIWLKAMPRNELMDFVYWVILKWCVHPLSYILYLWEFIAVRLTKRMHI